MMSSRLSQSRALFLYVGHAFNGKSERRRRIPRPRAIAGYRIRVDQSGGYAPDFTAGYLVPGKIEV